MAAAFVQKVWAAGTGASVTTGAINTTAGNLLVASGIDYDITPSMVISDNNTETWNPGVAGIGYGSSGICLEFVKDCTGRNGHTFTNSGGGNYPAIEVFEFSGVDTADPLDDVQTASSTGSSHTGPTVNPTTAGQLLISGQPIQASAEGTPTLTAGDWTAGDLQPDGFLMGGAFAYRIAGAAGTYTGPTFNTSSSQTEPIFTVTFKAAAAPPSGNPWYAYAQM